MWGVKPRAMMFLTDKSSGPELCRWGGHKKCGFRIAQVVRHHSENAISQFREILSELRELLREHPGTLPELREWPFHSESVFHEIGVVPRLLNYSTKSGQGELFF